MGFYSRVYVRYTGCIRREGENLRSCDGVAESRVQNHGQEIREGIQGDVVEEDETGAFPELDVRAVSEDVVEISGLGGDIATITLNASQNYGGFFAA